MLSALARFTLIGGVLALPLSGCGDRGDPAPEPTATEPVEAAPTPAAEETAVASIIRPEIVAEATPPEPLKALEATVPMPDGSELGPEAAAILAPLLESEQFAAGWPIVVRGHTDSTGSDEANLRASRRRAEAVAEWLTERGVQPARVAVIALGEQRPIAPNANLDGTPDPVGRARNRRVTVTLAPPPEMPSPAPAGAVEPVDPPPAG